MWHTSEPKVKFRGQPEVTTFSLLLNNWLAPFNWRSQIEFVCGGLDYSCHSITESDRCLKKSCN